MTKNRKKVPPSFKTSPGRKPIRKPGNYYSVHLIMICVINRAQILVQKYIVYI